MKKIIHQTELIKFVKVYLQNRYQNTFTNRLALNAEICRYLAVSDFESFEIF